MSRPPPTSPPTLRRLAAASVACATLGMAGAAGAAILLTWATGPAAAWAALTGALSVLCGTAAGIGLIAAVIGPRLERLGPAVIGAGVVRMFVSLSVAVLVWQLAGLEGRTLWTSFLAASLMCLAAETRWGMGASRCLGPVESGVSA
jgi:hypothetical protein